MPENVLSSQGNLEIKQEVKSRILDFETIDLEFTHSGME